MQTTVSHDGCMQYKSAFEKKDLVGIEVGGEWSAETIVFAMRHHPNEHSFPHADRWPDENLLSESATEWIPDDDPSVHRHPITQRKHTAAKVSDPNFVLIFFLLCFKTKGKIYWNLCFVLIYCPRSVTFVRSLQFKFNSIQFFFILNSTCSVRRCGNAGLEKVVFVLLFCLNSPWVDIVYRLPMFCVILPWGCRRFTKFFSEIHTNMTYVDRGFHWP